MVSWGFSTTFTRTRTLLTVELLLLSNSTNHGQEFLAHARDPITEFVTTVTPRKKKQRVVFVPYAAAPSSRDHYIKNVQKALPGLTVVSIDTLNHNDLRHGDVVFVGGGNTYRLLKTLRKTGWFDIIREHVLSEQGAYIGSSAGTNMACPTIRTTNDMPIVDPGGFDAFGFIPFQINPHYIKSFHSAHMGESRDTRILEFLQHNYVYVIGLPEGTWLQVSPLQINVGGETVYDDERPAMWEKGSGVVMFKPDRSRVPLNKSDQNNVLTELLSKQPIFDAEPTTK